MRKVIFLIFISALFYSSCSKQRTKKYQYRVIGYIYNNNDNTPFANTKFKVYSPPSSFNVTDAKESYFYTDSKGYFDFISEHSGGLVWPSYHNGASYVGPPDFGNSKRWETDEVNKLYISYYDTIYTTPYH